MLLNHKPSALISAPFSEKLVSHQVGGTVSLLGQRCRGSRLGFEVQGLGLQGVSLRVQVSKFKMLENKAFPTRVCLCGSSSIEAAVDIE